MDYTPITTRLLKYMNEIKDQNNEVRAYQKRFTDHIQCSQAAISYSLEELQKEKCIKRLVKASKFRPAKYVILTDSRPEDV